MIKISYGILSYVRMHWKYQNRKRHIQVFSLWYFQCILYRVSKRRMLSCTNIWEKVKFPSNLLQYHRKFKTKVCKIYLFPVKLKLLVYDILLITLISTASFQKNILINHNLGGKISDISQEISCENHTILLRSAGSCKKRRAWSSVYLQCDVFSGINKGDNPEYVEHME